MSVIAWKEIITIPTYKIGSPDKNPMFLENRVYQGSSGVVYPHPVIDKVYDEKENREWIALFLENDFLKIMILPELGGRIQMAYDKTNDYHFIYYNSVIKPALVGLAGPWISGGIEFNWPQHHRPSTFDPIDFTIEENADGSKTVWVNEYEKMFRTKCALGFTLYPDKSYIELHAKLLNRTPFPQTFLWWANPAVAVDEHYQSVFPPDVNAVFDHGRRDVSSFPIAKGTYYKVDYSPGTDISRYTNIPVPTSYMAVNSEFDFVGGYHHKRQAGMLHVADHHISPGKKQWTWGCGEFGKAWDRQLTDNDGPYFELMCGMFTDNQPDFSWIGPNETREFRQYFMPYKNIGYVKNASIEGAVNLEFSEGKCYIGVYLTEERTVSISLEKGSEIIHTVNKTLSPRETYSEIIGVVGSPQDFILIVEDDNGPILSYRPVEAKEDLMPDPATAIAEPAEILTNEELYLSGLHLEQYRHATYHAEDYYHEGLRRDPSDIRCNNAFGLLLLRRGQIQESESYFRTAVDKLIRRNPNPYESEPLYNLGLCLKYLGNWSEAYEYFFKASWNTALQDVCYLQLAFISAASGRWQEALQQIETSLSRNSKSLQARHLKAFLLRQLNRFEEGIKWINESLLFDKFDFGTLFEKYKITTGSEAELVLNGLKDLARNDDNTFIEISLDYANAGLYNEAFEILSLIEEISKHPLTYYYLGYYRLQLGSKAEASEWFQKGFNLSADKVFPNRIEDIAVLETVIATNPKDFKASYYLGNYYYAKRGYAEARKSWELSASNTETFATVYRNLGIAYFNKFDLKDSALQFYEKAFALDPTDARVLFELDQLSKKLNHPIPVRLKRLEENINLVNDRDDLYTEIVSLYVLNEQFDIARTMLASRNFHPWEGGEGKVSGLHVIVHVESAKIALLQDKPQEALELLHQALIYPENLGEGKLYGAQENDIYYWLGCAYQMMGESDNARANFTLASTGLSVPSQAIFYNDQQPDKIFYQGKALEKLGRSDEAHTRFQNLVQYGEENKGKLVKMDYFAVSLPDLMIFNDDLSRRNDIHCNYLIALGQLGLKEFALAERSFDLVITEDSGHIGAHLHKKFILTQSSTSAEVAFKS